MRIRGSVAIDLGTVNTLIWVAGRGIVLDEPSAIAIDSGTGAIVADRHRGRRPGGEGAAGHQRHPPAAGRRDRRSGRDGGDAARFPAQGRVARGPLRRNALVCVPSGATWVERRSVAAALEARRRYSVELIDEPVAAAAGAGLDLTAGAGGFIVDVGGGTTEVAAVAGWRVVRAESLRMAGNAMDEAIVNAGQERPGPDPEPAGGASAQGRARPHRRSGRLGGGGGPRRRPPDAAAGEGARRARRGRARAGGVGHRRAPCSRSCRTSRPGWRRTSCGARSG